MIGREMVNGEFWWERALDYYFEFRWWKGAMIFMIGFFIGRWG